MAKTTKKAAEKETAVEKHNDGTMSGLKKTIIGTLTTAIGGAGIWLSTLLGGGAKTETKDKDPKDGKAKTEQAAPAAPVVINLQNNNTNQQKQSGGTNTIIKEKTIIEKQAPAEKPADKPAKKSQTEDSPW
jgi:hypothetical protein